MAMPSTKRSLELRHYYTPKTCYTVCVGITPQVSQCNFPSAIKFRFELKDSVNNIRLRTDYEGAKGLLDLKQQMLAAGFDVPAEVGQSKPMHVSCVEIKSKSITVRIPDTFVSKSDRIFFAYTRSFGSFNSAMYSALHLLSVQKRMADIMQLQRDIINQTDGLANADSATLLAYTKRIHSPDFDAEFPKRSRS